MLSHPLYLVYLNPERQIFIDLDASKKFEFCIIIYNLKGYLIIREYPAKKVVEPILFLSRLLRLAETCYLSTELELADIV